MKGNVTRGGGFRGALNYAFDVGKDATGDKNAELIGGTMSGSDPRALAAEFGHTRRLRSDIKRPVWHCSLALPAGDRLNSQKWEDIAADFMREMGFPQDTQWVAVRHQDTDHDHIHIIASRISLSGQVWHGKFEAFKAIEATQVLEREHGLTVTQGLYDERQEKTRIKRGEVEMWKATGEVPPKLRLEGLILEAAKGQPTVVQFVDRLAAAGVEVKPNLASTGKLSGFSFKLDGIKFKGSQINKACGWPKLQANQGVTYEFDRDYEALSAYRAGKQPAVADHQPDQQVTAGTGIDAGAGTSAPVAAEPAAATDAVPGPDAGRPAPAAPAVPGTGTEPADRAADELARPGAGGADELRPGEPEPAPSAGRADQRAEAGVEPATDRDRQSDQRTASPGAADRQPTQGLEPADPAVTAGAGGAANQQPATEHQGAQGSPSVVETGGQPGSSRSRGRSSGNDWASRFRQASAAKRRTAGSRSIPGDMASSDRPRAAVDAADRTAAREVDPTPYLQSVGYRVKREGRHLSVYQGKDEAYRITRKPDGHWVACDHYGNGVGDNIALVQEIERNAGFAEAVYKLTGAPSVAMQPVPVVDRQPPRLPISTPTAQREGREYLADRGISQQTIEAAELAGMVRYTRGAVLFVGTDAAGTVQNVTRRATDPADEVQKRDLKGSDKQYPPVLPGQPGNSTVWVVEGGADALAVHDLYARQGKPAPAVVVSSGANVLSWADNPEIQQLVRGRLVVVAEEREKDADAQQRADNGHSRQREALQALGCDVQTWRPREGYKDLADYNERRGDVEQRKQQERAQRAAMRQERGHSGPELS